MPQWFLPYTAAALVAAALGWLALNYDPDAGSPTATPTLAGAPAPGKPVARPTAANNPAPAPAPAPPASAPAPVSAPAPAPDSGAEAAVRRVVRLAMVSDRPSDCDRYYTLAFHEQVQGESGVDALEECRDDADGDSEATAVRIRKISPVPAGYLTGVKVTDGEIGGAVFSMIVSNVRGSWKIDKLVALDLDFARLAQQFKREFEVEDRLGSADAECLAGAMTAMGEDRYERSFLEGRSDDVVEELQRMAINCFSVRTLSKILGNSIRSAAGDGAPKAIIECVVDRIVGGKSAAELRNLILSDDVGRGYEMGQQAAADCARDMSAVS